MLIDFMFNCLHQIIKSLKCTAVKFWNYIQHRCSVTGLNLVHLIFLRNESYLRLVLSCHLDGSLWLSERYGNNVYVNR